MRILATLALVCALGGCQTAGILEKITGVPAAVFTTTVNNPITKADLADVERGYQAALGVANVYVELCRSRQIARVSCRPVVERIQSYVGQAHSALVGLRGFVRNNDTVNAATAIAAVRNAISDFQASPDYQAIGAATATVAH